MSLHSCSRCWLHLVWGTLKRERLISTEAANRISEFLYDYGRKQGIHMKVNYVNADHVHAVIDLQTNQSIESVMQLLKGASSHWINEQNLTNGKFTWGRGYAAFSVSESVLPQVVQYIINQKEHHHDRSFLEEYRQFLDKHGIAWQDEEI
jgi:putative transposase